MAMHRWGITLAVVAILLVLAGALFVTMRRPSLDKTSEALTVDTQSPALVPGSAGKMSAWIFTGEIPAAAWERIIREFEKTSGYRVQLTVYDSEEKYRESLRVALAERRLPEVFLIESTEAEALKEAGQIVAVETVPTDATEWVPGALATFQRGEKTLGFPSEFTLLALYYNTSSFDRVGVAYPDVHWTWETLLGISQAIYRAPLNEQAEPLYSLELPLRFDVWQTFAAQAGGGLYAGSTWQVGAPNALAAQVKSLTYLRDFLKRYVIVPRPPSAVSGKLFVQGRASMAIAGAELLRELRSRPDLRWGVAPLPKDENRSTVVKARGWTVSAQCPSPKDAARLARALATQPSRSSWLSAHVGAGTSHSPAEQVFFDAAAYAQPLPFIATSPELERIINEELLRWINQDNPSPEAMIEWTQKLLK
ncbi:MAG: hypothetical protein B9S32_16360 [Verrucomicrobia bacterium Tous-C9LFEB]|nr:MAG: hypothetical protein B9S32_16360 [Verrucomicrobia bacterium Tous-C9LFEB]